MMRPFEISFAVALLLQWLCAFEGLRHRLRLRLSLAVVAGLLLLAQVLIEGWRWQLGPLLLVALWLAWRLWIDHESTRKGIAIRRWGWAGRAGSLLLWGIGLLLLWLLPVPHFPPPAGPYAVGSLELALTDPNRQEIYGDDPAQARALMVQIWYPATPQGSEPPTPWLHPIDEQIRALARSGGIPPWLLNQLRYVRTHSVQRPPVAAGLFPILFFEHGYGGFRSQATFWVEDLASQGFIVIATEHPYAALNTIFPDGRRIPFDPDTLPEDAPDDVYDAAARRLLQQWVADMVFVQDTLHHLPSTSPAAILQAHMNWQEIFAGGHSTGGASALQFCKAEPNCKAVIALDPWLKPLALQLFNQPYPRPVLAIFSDPAMAYFKPENHIAFSQLTAHSEDIVCDLTLTGSGHHDFDDTGTFSPLARWFGHSKGPIAIQQAYASIRRATQAFLTVLDKAAVSNHAPALPQIDDPLLTGACR